MSRFSDPNRAAAALASRQAGAISRTQAHRAGLTDEQIEGRCAGGALHRRVPGVYVFAGTPDTPLQRAWVAFLAVGPEGVLSYLTAAALQHGAPHPRLPETTVPPRSSARSRAAKVHREHVPFVDRTWCDGLRVTTPSRTLVDLAGVLERPRLEEIVDATLCRRLASQRSTLAALGRASARKRGAPLLRSVLDVWRPTIEPGSVAEMRLLRLLAELGVVGLVSQYDVRDADGGFVARLDLGDPPRRRGLEYDGVEAHSPRTWARGEARAARLKALGWTIDTVTKLDLLPGEPRLAILARSWHLDRSA